MVSLLLSILLTVFVLYMLGVNVLFIMMLTGKNGLPKPTLKNYPRVFIIVALLAVYYLLYFPALAADKFSTWFFQWDLETFGL